MISLNVNGTTYQVNVDEATPLLWVLRDTLGLTGTKYGCGIEQCGACTVLVDVETDKACHIDVGSVGGHRITTIEGLSSTTTHPVQLAWIAKQVPQCGYCQSGMILATAALLKAHPHPTDGDIADAIGNICVCGTYQRVRDAIHSIAG